MKPNLFHPAVILSAFLMLFCMSCSSFDSGGTPSYSPPVEIDSVTFLNRKNDLSTVLQKTEDTAVLYFTSRSCRACKPYSRTVKNTAKTLEHQKNIRFISYEISFDESAIEPYGIEILPTTLIIRRGETVKKLIGPVTKDELIKNIQQAAQTP